MLTTALRRGGLVLLAASALLFASQSAALAGGGPGGDPLGGVQCGQTYSPSCTVTAGTAGSTQTTGAGVSGPGGGCAGTFNAQFGCIPPGCHVTVSTVVCPLAFAGPGGPPAPGVLAQLAVRYLKIPSPVIRSSPSTGILQLTHLPIWLWISPAIWAPVSQTAAVPGERVTATATPVSVSWQMGDGSTVTCLGPGKPYTASSNPASASPDCGYTYQHSSAGQPGSAFQVTVTITWNITYTVNGAPGGTLAPLFSAAVTAFRVAESQGINTASGSM